MQLVDESAQGPAFLLFDARHAAKGGRTFGIAAGLGAGDRLSVALDPVLDNPAVLVEQPQKVVGLALIRRLGDGSYAVGGFTYYIRPEGGAAPVLRQSGGAQELLVPVSLRNGEATVSYGILW